MSDVNIYQVLEQISVKYNMSPEGGEETYSEFYSRNRSYWSLVIKALNRFVYDIYSLPDLQSVVYGKRQEVVELYHELLSAISIKTEEYKRKTAGAYNKLREAKIPNTPTLYYPTDGSIKQQIDGMFSQEKYVIDISNNHAEFLDATIKTIDGIIYSISNRIKLEEIKLGR